MRTPARPSLLAALLAGAALALVPSAASAATHQALERPTELQYWDRAGAYDGYTFFGVGGKTYLLDMEGRVVHTWPIGTNPHLQDDGSILDAATDDPSGFGGFKRVGWDGSTLWSYTETRSTYHPHHDFTRIYNPKLKAYTVLYIANKDLTYAQLVAAGADPAKTPSTGAQMDAIVEVDASGTIVWEWCFFDHMVQDLDATKSNYVGTGKTVADFPHRLNINLAGHLLKGDWLHCNSLDYNQSLDQIVVNSVQGEFYVVDHGNTFVAGSPAASIALAATSAGDFLYRFGDPARYAQGTKPQVLDDWTLSTTGNKQLGGAHDIQWIEAGLPGAEHFLVFNNAEYLSEHTSHSSVVEINPHLDASGNDTGSYVNPPDAGYTTVAYPAVTDNTPRLISKQVVWTHVSKGNLTLFSTIGSSAQRLPNGNTLICADTDGYVMEITPAGKTVWDYIVPVLRGSIALVLGDRLPMVNSIFRAFRYPATHPALAGRTLTPGATIAGRTTVDNPYAGTSDYQTLQRPTETQYWDTVNAYGGYTLFAAQGTAYLVDMQGRVAHTWSGATDPRLLENGRLLDWTTQGGLTGLKEVDWSGNTVWEHLETRPAYHPHGDFKRIYDPKLGAPATLYLANRDVTSAECLAAGCDPAQGPYDGAQVDTIVEVDSSGNVVWEWSFWDHAIQTVAPTKLNYAGAGKTVADYPGKIHLNLPGRGLRSNWLDCNSIDYNQTLDQVMVNSRQGEVYVIDRGSTFVAGDPAASKVKAASSAGDFLYRFGDPARYGQGSAPSVGTNWETATSGNKQIGGSSNAQWIATGLPGAGRLLVFDNNQYLYQRTPQSYVFEINPYLNSSGTDTGSYVNPPSAGYATWTFDKDTMKANQLLSKQVVWKYGSVSNLTLFSHLGSSAQRLPNGNTLICATTEGYLLEVDASGNVVWEYINPVTDAGVVKAVGDNLPMANAVPRATRFPATFAGFTGHDLTAVKTIVEGSSAPTAAFTFSPASPAAGDTVTFTDTSANTPTSWTWTFGDGGTSPLQNPTHAYAVAGTFTVSLTVTNASGSATASQNVVVTAGSATVGAVRFLPIVLDVTGRARYVSELSLANRGTTDASVTLLYTSASAFGDLGSGSATLSLPAGRQLVVDDAIAFLRTKGLAIPTGNQGGSLRVTFANLSSEGAASALVRITAPSENGRAGVAYVAPRLEELPTTSTSWLHGLRSSSQDRTNVAFANASTSSSITLRLTLFNGDGSSQKVVLQDVTLASGQWSQLDDVFTGTGFSQGYASIAVVSGSGPYFAYAVINDQVTNDGSFASFEVEPAVAEARLLSVVVETGTYSSEVVLTNRTSLAQSVQLSYVESLSPSQGAGGGAAVTATETLAAGEQMVITSILDELRLKASGSIGPKGGSYAGTLSARFLTAGNLAAGYAGARTGSPAKTVAGRYGLFTSGVGTSSRARTSAWIYGLRQDSAVRSNVAASASPENAAAITVQAEVYDGSTGKLAGTTGTVSLAPGGWTQWSGLLSTYGVTQGYVRVLNSVSSGTFSAYGVVNDGPTPGSATGTDDGSFIPGLPD